MCKQRLRQSLWNVRRQARRETAVSWIRHRLARTVPEKAWEETREQFTSRLKQACSEINDTLDVEGLCQALPKRIQELIDKKGDRLGH